MSWPGAGLRALLIFAYFGVATAWLPSAVLRTSFVAGSSRLLADVVVLGVWGIFFGLGLWGLRFSQERGWI